MATFDYPTFLTFAALVQGYKEWQELTSDEQMSILGFLGFEEGEFGGITTEQLSNAIQQKVTSLEGTTYDVNPVTGGFVASTDTDAAGGFTPPPAPGDEEDTAEAAKLARQRERNTRLGLTNYLSSIGVPMTPNLQALINEALTKNYNSDAFQYWLRQTPEYKDRFPGIFNSDGTMKMDESTYLSQERQYQDIAAQAGLNAGDGKLAYLFQNDISPSEFSLKALAIRRLRSNPELYKQFSRTLVREGIAGPGDVSKQELFKFVLGMGNASWYNTWNQTYARYAANQAGIKIQRDADRYLELTPGMIERISRKDLTPEELEAGFEQVSEDLLNVLPLAHIQSFGLSKKDILQARFGGPHSATIRQKIERIMNQEEQFFQSRATPQTYTTEEGGLGVLGQGMQRGTAE